MIHSLPSTEICDVLSKVRQEVIAFRWAHGLQTDQVFHVRRMIPGAVVAIPAPLPPTRTALQNGNDQ